MTETSVCTECAQTIMPLHFDCDDCKCAGCLYRVGCGGFSQCKICQNQCNGDVHCGDCEYMVQYIVDVIKQMRGNSNA